MGGATRRYPEHLRAPGTIIYFLALGCNDWFSELLNIFVLGVDVVNEVRLLLKIDLY